MAQTAPELVSENGLVYPTRNDVPPAGEPKNQPPFNTPVAQSTPVQGTGILAVRSADQLNNVASSEVNSEIEGQISPLQSQFDTTSAQEERTRQAIESMFGTIQPYVAGAAQNVAQSYDEAENRQQQIFSAAMTQLNQLKQSRAQEAQALAQEMGGPVALSEFTAGMDDTQGQLANLGAGQMLHTLGYAQAGVQEANAFAGRVFPLIHTEEQAKARNYFEDKKRELQDQITALKGSAASKIEARKNELLVQEREYALQKTQQALDKIKATHDWQATLRTLKNDDKRLSLTDRQFALQEAGVTGKYKGKPTLQQQALTIRDMQFVGMLSARASGIA